VNSLTILAPRQSNWRGVLFDIRISKKKINRFMNKVIIIFGLIGSLLISCNDNKKKSNKELREIDKKALQDSKNRPHISGELKRL
jgi:hypothetical protein